MTALYIAVVAAIIYILLELDVKRNWAPWTELARLTFFAGLLAYLLK